MNSPSPIHVNSYKLRSELIQIDLIKKHFRIQTINHKKCRIPLSINTKLSKVPILSIKGVKAKQIICKLKVSLKKLPRSFYTPTKPKPSRVVPKVSIKTLPGTIELQVQETKFPEDKTVFIPAIKKKYPLLALEDIVFYKYFPLVDVAKLTNFKFVEKKLLVQFDFSISKSKQSSLVFFIDRRNKLTRFVAIDK